MKHIPPEIRKRLLDRGLRLTNQRRAVISEILSSPGHFSADELAVRLYSASPSVSRATVYRVLPELARVGLIRQVIYAEGHTHYEMMTEASHHEHLICDRCGAIIEFCASDIEQALTRVCKEHGFAETHHKVEVTGLCAQCRKEKGCSTHDSAQQC